MNSEDSMYRRESIKLDIEIRRCRHWKRQHLPVRFVLQDQRWKKQADARIRQKRVKL